ncbi:MAG: NusG domain II-containing protein [Ruminococcaceae bacterium]|nr:NusG domain II-containing protein [Oscillospiraceae bacterium]
MKKQRFLISTFKKGDFFIFSMIIAVAIAAAIGFYRSPLSANTVTIYVDSREYATYSISEGYEKEIMVKTDYGYNQIYLNSGMVAITDSDCPNHDCVQMGTISQAGDMLICLPHKLMIMLEGGDKVDAVSY